MHVVGKLSVPFFVYCVGCFSLNGYCLSGLIEESEGDGGAGTLSQARERRSNIGYQARGYRDGEIKSFVTASSGSDYLISLCSEVVV